MTDQEKLAHIQKLAELWTDPYAAWAAIMVDYGQIHREIGELLLEILST